MRPILRKTASFLVRWGIAVVGIAWVVTHMSIADHSLILKPTGQVVEIDVLEETSPGLYLVEDQQTRHQYHMPAGDLISAPDREKVRLTQNEGAREVFLMGMDIVGDARNPQVQRLLVADQPGGAAFWVSSSAVEGGFQLRVPHPRVATGLRSMVYQANPVILILSIAIFPITIVLTSIRWRRMLAALEIRLTLGMTLALNMVGLFYNTFIPMGSTGGDLLKAYYASKHTHHKARAVLSVLIDRVIGLIVLIILGGMMAGTYWLLSPDKEDPASRACGHVAIMAAMITASLAAVLLVGRHPKFRAVVLSERLLSKLPMRQHVEDALDVLAIYRQQPMLVLWAMLITVPVHVTVIVSALLAGKAFGLPLSWGYYFVVVPVTVLVGSIPISPQGAGVMEFFAINLTARQGATVSQAFALTMSIRAVQILWNLLGGVFLIGGQYRAPRNLPDMNDQMIDPPPANHRGLVPSASA